MDKRKMLHRLVEGGKDVLILALVCSAVWLFTRTGMLGPLSGLLQEEDTQITTGQSHTVTRAEAARPLRMSAVLNGVGQSLRYGVQYDEVACDALFQQVVGPLREVLSSAGEPQRITRSQWERALTTAPGVCFDFQGEVPLTVLCGWLSGEAGELTAHVRRVALAVWEDGVALYYRDEEDGEYYRCQSQVTDPFRLEDALAGLNGNDVHYAFESERYNMLDPDTMVDGSILNCGVYSVVNPVAGGREILEMLADELKFSINANGIYYAGEWVARSDNDTLRLSDQGTVDYLAGNPDSIHFLVPGEGLFDAVEACRQLAATAMGTRCGQARLYLLSAEETPAGMDIRFGYCLNGTPVWMEEGYAARFLVSNGRVNGFTMQFKNYTGLGEDRPVLPTRQAAAALEAMKLEGEELALVYLEQEDGTVAADWVSARSGVGER